MKKLEADSAALVEVRHHLSLATSKLRETALVSYPISATNVDTDDRTLNLNISRN
jgi:hypothetical protein